MKSSLNEVADLLIAVSGLPRLRLLLATTKDMARCGEEQEDLKDQPRVQQNARFTPLSLMKALIPYLLIFCRF